jgi:hypothetical protein
VLSAAKVVEHGSAAAVSRSEARKMDFARVFMGGFLYAGEVKEPGMK